MKKIIMALVVLAVVGIGTYYTVFNNSPSETPANTLHTYTPVMPNNQKTNTSVPAIEPQTAPTPIAPAAPGVTVNIKNFSFNPSTLTVKTGTRVTWINNDAAPHTVTSDSGALLNSPTLSSGQSFSFTFANPGSINYHCNIHPTMKGKIVVQN